MNEARILAPHALLPTGWARDVLLAWDADGRLTAVQAGASAAAEVPRAAGPVLPGMPNLHSHAFQRGFAGLTEYRSVTQGGDPAGADSFWSWRTQMYRFAQRLSPDTLEAIATQLYIEMLRAGYTSVCEFHYVHHDFGGKPYADAAEMSLRLLRAADRAGIGMTLLPVLYQTAGFGDKPPLAEQRRFLHDTDAMLKLLERLAPACAQHGARLGLRRIRCARYRSKADACVGRPACDGPYGSRTHPYRRAAARGGRLHRVDRYPARGMAARPCRGRCTLVPSACHAYGLGRTPALAHSGAVAGICPTTEANLGDGVFEAAPYLAQHGAWGIGSDSHASVSVAEELRVFEYGQRLALQQRNVLASESHMQVADRLYLEAVSGGARASGRAVAGLAPGQQADSSCSTVPTRRWRGSTARRRWPTHVFANHGHETLAEVRTAGRCRVQHGAHPLQAEAGRLFVAARRACWATETGSRRLARRAALSLQRPSFSTDTPAFTLHRGTRPLLVSMPHVGTHLPATVSQRLTAEARTVPDTDWHLERLYDFARELGASVLAATHSRYVVDLNRPPDNANLYPGQDTTGLCPVDTFDKTPLYANGVGPDDAEIVARRDAVWRPYHGALAEELARLRQQHGTVALWDAHSIRSVLPRFFEGKLPDFNLGTANGESCDASLADQLLEIAQDVRGIRPCSTGASRAAISRASTGSRVTVCMPCSSNSRSRRI